MRSRKINLQIHVKELQRARTTTGIHAEMCCVRFDVHIPKKRKENHNGCIKQSYIVWSSTSPCAMCHCHHSTASLNKRDTGSSQQQPRRGGEDKEMRGKPGDSTTSIVEINWHNATIHLLYSQKSLKVFWLPPLCTSLWALDLTLFRDIWKVIWAQEPM